MDKPFIEWAKKKDANLKSRTELWKSPDYRKRAAKKKMEEYQEQLTKDKGGRKTKVGYQSNVAIDDFKDPPKKKRKVNTCEHCGKKGHKSKKAKSCIYNEENPKYKGPYVPPVVPNPSQDDAGTGDGEDGSDSDEDGNDSDVPCAKV